MIFIQPVHVFAKIYSHSDGSILVHIYDQNEIEHITNTLTKEYGDKLTISPPEEEIILYTLKDLELQMVLTVLTD